MHSPAPWYTDPRFPGHILSGPITTTPAGHHSAHIICRLHGTQLPTAPHNQALILAAPHIPALVLAARNALHIAPIYSGGRPDVAQALRQALHHFPE
jgi:hypothetical protein